MFAEKYLVLMLDARGRGIHHIFKLVSAMQLVKKSGGRGGSDKTREKRQDSGKKYCSKFL